MELTRIRSGDTMTVTLSGRLDASGAAELDIYLEHAHGEETSCNLLLDMSAVSYLSSAALRILSRWVKLIESEHCRIAFYGLQPFCRDVLRLTGFERVFHLFPSRAEALGYCRENIGKAIVQKNIPEDILTGTGARYRVVAAGGKPGKLVVGGDIANIYHSRLSATMVHGSKLGSIRNSLGFGAMGSDSAEFLPLVGHAFCIDGMSFMAPPGGSPDYLLPADSDIDALFMQCGFFAALHGDFQELIRAEAASGGVELGAMIRELLSFTARRHPRFKGMCWLTMIADIGSVFANTMKQPPLAATAPRNGKMIIHPANRGEWFVCDQLPCLREGTALVSSVAVDLMSDLSDYSELLLERVFRLNPASVGGHEYLFRAHAALLRNAGFNFEAGDFNAEARRVAAQGELHRVGELQEGTVIREALIGLSMIDELEMPEQLDVLFPHRLDQRLNRTKTLLDAYGLNISGQERLPES